MRGGTAFRGALLALIIGIAVWLVARTPTAEPPPPVAPTSPDPRAPAASGSGLVIPVAGIRPDQLSDTFLQARGGGRPHDAIDIMAPRGTPVVAAAEGIVEKLHFSHGGGGITVYVRSPDRRLIHYYAHLDRYAPGLAEGGRLSRGDPIGFVGSTGNASPDGPHLHFAIREMAPDERWWQGRALNPYPMLTGRANR
ncbi:MAG TPA: M23 family metallopeptidase [Allosphingosinicella sp.]|nr:M23 family metallopeptidase [Allosphingosinicella sp.]